MIPDDMREITEVEREAVPVGNNYQEMKTHGESDFPLIVYPVVLSQMYLKTIRWHWHPEIEMIYMLEGEVEVFADENSFILSPGEGILINQNVLHAVKRIEGKEAVFFSVVFHPDMIFGYGSASLSVKYVSPILENSDMKYLLINDNDPYTNSIIKCMKKIRDHYTNKQFGYELECKAWLCHMWSAILSTPRKEKNPQAKSKRIISDEQRIKDAILYIEKNYADQISLDDIAASIHISKSECCRCFQRVLHQSPFEYLLRFRIFQATKMIRKEDPVANSISNLAITVGFGNISYFNKVFKKYMHMTPTEYKKQETGVY